MIRSTRLQLIAMLGIGAVGGYLAASGRLPLLQRSDAAPPTQNSAASATPCCDGADRTCCWLG